MDVALGVLAGVGTAAVLWKLFFNDLEDFGECVKYWLTPDAWSFFKGEFMEDWWAELKLGAWLGLSGLVGFGVFQALQ